MTRLIKLIMVATLVVASVAQAQIFNENYKIGSYNTEVLAAVTASNGVTYVSGTGLTVTNDSAVFTYKDTEVGAPNVTNALVEFTVIPVLNDAIPTGVDGAAVVFWVGTDSNVYRLVSNGVDPDTTDSNVFNVILSGTPVGTIAFSVTNNYVAGTFDLVANGDLIFVGVDFYDTTPTNLSQLIIRETSTTDGAVVEFVKVNELSPTGVPTAVKDAILKVYTKDGKVYAELELLVHDGLSTSFEISRGDLVVGTIIYDGSSVYTIELNDPDTVLGQTYRYTVTDIEGATVVGGFEADITLLPVLEAKAFTLTQTHMTLVFASVPDETYKIVGLTALVGGVETVVADDIPAAADGYETSVLVDIINQDTSTNFYFQIIKK